MREYAAPMCGRHCLLAYLLAFLYCQSCARFGRCSAELLYFVYINNDKNKIQEEQEEQQRLMMRHGSASLLPLVLVLVLEAANLRDQAARSSWIVNTFKRFSIMTSRSFARLL